jgi:hypothetical protein
MCTVQPKEAEHNQTRFTVGGDRINYPGKISTPTVEMLVAKMLFNSTISTKDARFITMDISNFYLMAPLHLPEFICMKLSDIPDKVINEYKLREKATPDGSIDIKAKRGMYGQENGYPNPSIDNARQPAFILQQEFRSFKNTDPEEEHQKAIPISVISKLIRQDSTKLKQATDKLATVGIFFAMHSCEYLKMAKLKQ